MKINQICSHFFQFAAIGIAMSLLPLGKASPYASCVTNNNGTIQFYINESGGNVTVTYEDGSTNVNFDGYNTGTNLPSGSYSFSLVGHTSYSISVFKVGTGSTTLAPNTIQNANINTINGPAYPVPSFFILSEPRGIAVNQNITSPNFGHVYVGRSLPSAPATFFYQFDADGTFISSNSAGVAWTSSSSYSPYQFLIASDDSLIVGDGSSANAGVWKVTPNLTTNQLVLGSIGDLGTNSSGQTLHGEIISPPLFISFTNGGSGTLMWIDADYPSSDPNAIMVLTNVYTNSLPYEGKPPIVGPEIGLNLDYLGSVYPGLSQGPNGYIYCSEQRGNYATPDMWVLDQTGTNAIWNSLVSPGAGPDYFVTQVEGNGNQGVVGCAVSPDGKWLVGLAIDNHFTICQLTNGIPNIATIYTVNPSTIVENARGICFDAADNIYMISSGEDAAQEWTLGLTMTAVTAGNASGVTGFHLVYPQSEPMTITWTNTAGGNWSDATNWSPNQVPGLANNVNITNAGSYTVTVNSNASVNMLSLGGTSGTQALSISAGTFTLNGLATINTNGQFTLSGGTVLGGSITMSNSASLLVSSGTLDGVTVNGTVDVGNTYSGANLTVTNGLVLNGTALVGNPTNSWYGAINFEGSQTLSGNGMVVFGDYSFNALYLGSGGTALTIGSGITVEGQSGMIGQAGYPYYSAANVSVINEGTISANVSGGTIAINAQPFINNNTIDAEDGTIQFQGTNLLSNGALEVGINGANNNGQISFSGEANFGGTLQAHFNEGYIPDIGVTFTLLNYSSQSGVFTSVSLPPAAQWQISAGTSALTITATNVLFPVITFQPQSLNVLAGSTATFTVVATNGAPFSYQWQFDGTNLFDGGQINGSESNFLTISVAVVTNAGNYQVIVANVYGSVTSDVADLLVTQATSYFQAITNLNPVGYWPLQETNPPAPVSMETNYGTLGPLGNAYYSATNASVVNFAQTGALVGDADSAAAFGVGQISYAFVPRFSPAMTIKAPFSVEAWVNQSNSTYGIIVGEGGGEGLNGNDQYGGFQLGFGSVSGSNEVQMEYYTGGDNNYTQFNDPSNCPVKTWYHLVATYDGTNSISYLNGYPMITGVVTQSPDLGGAPLCIGNGKWTTTGGQRQIYALIDEVAVYTNVLSPGRVAQHFNAGVESSKYGTYMTNVLADKPLLYYRMDCTGFTNPPESNCPKAVNYGSASVNGFYLPGIVPGAVAGPGSNNVAAPINGLISCVDAGIDPSFNPTGANPFTAICWFKGNPADGRFQAIMGHGSTNWSMNVDGSSGHMALSIMNGNLESSSVVNDGNWHFLAGADNGSNICLYVDGRLDTVAPLPGTNGLTGEPNTHLYLGGNMDYTRVGSNQEYLSGAIAQAALFTNALSASQIQQIYTTAVATLTMTNTEIVPIIITQPTNQIVLPDASAQFSVAASGSVPFAYQWFFNGTNLRDSSQISGSQSNVLTIGLAVTADAGNYQVIITNVYGSATSILASLMISNIPDLAPVSVGLPVSGVSGTSIQVSCVVTNQGTGSASGPWADGIYFTSNAVPNVTNATLLGWVYENHNVTGGGSYAWTNSVTLPQVPAGAYYLFVVVDDSNYGDVVYEVTKTNNISAAIPLSAVTPDLAPVSVGLPVSGVSGTTIQVSCVVTNQGTGSASGPWADGIYFTSNAVPNVTNATLLASVYGSHNVGAGSSYAWTNTVTLPQVPAGTYYLFVVVDDPSVYGDAVYEVTKTNNISGAIPLSAVTPDLAPVSVGLPVSGVSGTTIQVSCVVTNQGTGSASGPWADGIYFTSNAVPNVTNATLLASVYESHNVGAGSSYAWTNTVTLPQVPAGTYYLFVVVDDPSVYGDAVYEVTKTNNISGAIPLSAVTPDLAPVSVGLPVSGVSGTTIQVSCVVTNQGTGSASGPWADGIYFTSNAVPNVTNATLLASVYESHNVGAGSSYAWTNTVTLPQVPAGTYYLFVVVDDPSVYGDAVYEVTKTNNISGAIPLSAVTPDLAPVSVGLPVSGVSGTTIQVSCVVTNQGTGSASGPWADGIYFTSNAVPNVTNATLLASVYESHNVGAGSSYAWTNTVTLPQVPAGTYYLFVVVDDPSVYGDAVYEVTKTNNISGAIPLSAVTPDLAPVSVGLPVSGVSGTTIQVSCVVTNQGTGSASGPWADGIYFTSNAVPNVTNATLLASVYESHNVGAGSSYAWTNTVTLPQVPAGTYYLFVVVDDPSVYGDTVYEVTKTNNITRAIPIQVGSADLAIDNIAGPLTAVIAQPVQVVFTITNEGTTSAIGPWQNQFLLANNTNGIGAQTIGTFSITNILIPGSFVTLTQTVILPTTVAGTKYFGLFVDSADNVPELNKSNNIAFASSPIFITGPDLDMEKMSAPGSAEFGQAFTVTFAVTNIGGASATANWDDQIYLSSSPSSISGATLLATIPGNSPLAPGNGYTISQSVSVPLTSSATSENFYIIAVANANDAQLEVTTTNSQLAAPIALTLPPLPDLTVGQVTSPASAIAGQTLTISWAVTNIGNANAVGPWQEAVYLLPTNVTLAQFTTNVSAYTALGTFLFTNDLAPGQSIGRTQQLTMPLMGIAGELQAGVYVNSGNTLVEQTETNNAALALSPMDVPLALSMEMLFTNLLETTSIPNIPCLVLRNGDLTQSVVVSLSGIPTNNLTVPPSIAIPAGVATAPFTVTVVNNGVPGPDIQASVVAIANNYLSATSQVTIVNDNVPGLSLSLASDEITMGQNVAATITSTTASSDPITVAVTSSGSTALTIPVSVTIPANSNSVTFTVTATQSSVLAPPQNYVVSASATGYTGSTANLTVLNDNTPTLTLSLNTTNINEADGPFAAIGTVSYQPVSSQPLTVSLISTNHGAALVPAQITIPALTGNATFYVAAVNDTNINGPKLTMISAEALDVEGDPVGYPASELLAVQDNNGPALRMSIVNPVVQKGEDAATVGSVWTATPPTNDLIVMLTSSDTNEATVPSTVTIPAGQTNAIFNIISLDDGLPFTSQTLSVTASATNYASGSAVLAVTDLGLPDLIVQNITAPGAIYTDQSLTIGFRLLNQGLGTLTNGVTQNVYLTTNALSGPYILVGTSYAAGPLGPGQSADESVVVPGSILPAPGLYWIVVTANADSTAQELTGANNSGASISPVAISPTYSATVQTSVTNVLMGTSIPLFGSATLTAGGPATNVPVYILVTVRGLQRIVSVMTDINGDFSTMFTPLSNEAGTYTISAVLPGITTAPAQAQFNILGMSANPSSEILNVGSGGSSQNSITINNLSDVPLTGLTATPNGLAANLTANATLATNYLEGQSTVGLALSVSASDASIQQSSFTVRLASAEGAVLDMPVSVTVIPPQPQLVVSPSQLRMSMLVGGQSQVQFEVANVGGAPTGPLALALPSVPWLSVASGNSLPVLAPGQSNLVTLLLTPAANLALGPYTGTLAVNGTAATVEVPFSFDAVSDAHGSLLIQSVDELTFFATNAPPLTNASVILTDPSSGEVVTSGATDSNGLFFVSGLMAGTYKLVVTANQHSSFNGSAVIAASETNTVQAFLSLQTVTYTWTVVPTQVQVQNQIIVQAIFQTDVPAPVIVPTPASLDLSSLNQAGQFIDVPLTLANEGLIGVTNVTISLNSSDLYEFDILTTNIGNLAAHSTVTVPLRVTFLGTGVSSSVVARAMTANGTDGASKPLTGSESSCTPSLAATYSYPCGPFGVSSGIQFPIFNAQTDCGTTPTPSGGTTVKITPSSGGVGFGGYGGVWYGPPATTTPSSCDECLVNVVEALSSCGQSIISGSNPKGGPLACLSDMNQCGYSLASTGLSATAIKDCLMVIPDCSKNAARFLEEFPELAAILALVGCSYDVSTACSDPATGAKIQGFTGLSGSAVQNQVVTQVNQLQTLVAPVTYLFGNNDWIEVTNISVLESFCDQFDAYVSSDSNDAEFVTAPERAALLASPLPFPLTTNDVNAFIDRWNLSMSNYTAGIFYSSQDPGDPNFIAYDEWTNLTQAAANTLQMYKNEGYDDPYSAWLATKAAIITSVQGSSGTCAQVTIQLDQTAVLTLNAFHATLQLDDNGNDLLTNISANIVVRNQEGDDLTSLFNIQTPTLSGSVNAVDGTGVLVGGQSGSAQWTLIPSAAAAPQVATNYLVSGTLSYNDNGLAVTIPLAPESITVQPSPQVYLNYFIQQDVYGNDPFISELEPSIPFAMGVMAQNQGYGTADNFQITSAQPTIVDNQKGLLIGFNIIETEVNGQPASPSLTANFGNLLPNETAVGVWYMTSTLDGQFTGISATYLAIDPLGNPTVSFIDGIQTHIMTHLVQAQGVWDDGLPDFLVNDIPNPQNLPDTVYLSSGQIEQVSVVQSGSASGAVTSTNLQIRFTANFPAGFTYVAVSDPANGQFTLTNIVCSDGTSLLTNDFWMTYQTFVGLYQPPLLQTNLHIFVYHTNAGPDTYTLEYGSPVNFVNTNPPVSSVFSLPAESPPTFGVAWSGELYVGGAPIAYYDIYVSDNGGPFADWQSETTANSALFDGTNGHIYAFYSVATDTAGHREAAPSQSQAQTTVGVYTNPPTISIVPAITLNAGQTVSLGVTAGDANPESVLTFSLVPGAPAGVVVNPATGHITWQTSPLFGGTTNIISVIVSDNSQPPLTATGTVAVVLVQVANPPMLAPISDYAIYEAQILTITNYAVDENIPTRPLSFSLGAGAPTNATIDPVTGVFEWQPNQFQAPSTNIISVIVTDNGNPPLSAKQSFTVYVIPAYEFTLSLGSTNLLVGTTSSVPITLQTSLQLTNISALISVPSMYLTNLTLQPVSPEILSTLVQSLGTNLYAINFALNPALSPGSQRTLAQLGFVAKSQTNSAVILLGMPQLSAIQNNGQIAAKPGAFGGVVFVIGTRPILNAWLTTNSQPMLTLYGYPGANYEIDYTTNLVNGNWQPSWQLQLTNTFVPFNVNGQLPNIFFRALAAPTNSP